MFNQKKRDGDSCNTPEWRQKASPEELQSRLRILNDRFKIANQHQLDMWNPEPSQKEMDEIEKTLKERPVQNKSMFFTPENYEFLELIRESGTQFSHD